MTEAIKSIESTAAALAAGPAGVSGASAAAVAPPAPVLLPPSATADEAEQPADAQAIRQAMAEVMAQAADAGVELSYHVDEDLQRVIVEVRDRSDGTVLRQIPGEEVLRLARQMKEAQGGLLQVSV